MSVLHAGLLVTCLLLPATCSNILCSEPSICHQRLGPDSHCKVLGSQGNCSCNPNYYLLEDDIPHCDQCPGVGESCEVSQCCGKGLVCREGVCFCVYINEYCWTLNDSERARFQRVAQCILAVALILTTSILFFLFWKACTRRDVANRHHSRGSFQSLNSIQRLVLMQLQDRPPRYSAAYLHSWKDPAEFLDSPPTYIEALGQQGQNNAAFTLAESPGTICDGTTTTRNTALQNQRTTVPVNVPLSTHASQIPETTVPSTSDTGENTSMASSSASQVPESCTTNNSSTQLQTSSIVSHLSPPDYDFVNVQNDINRHLTLHM